MARSYFLSAITKDASNWVVIRLLLRNCRDLIGRWFALSKNRKRFASHTLSFPPSSSSFFPSNYFFYFFIFYYMIASIKGLKHAPSNFSIEILPQYLNDTGRLVCYPGSVFEGLVKLTLVEPIAFQRLKVVFKATGTTERGYPLHVLTFLVRTGELWCYGVGENQKWRRTTLCGAHYTIGASHASPSQQQQ